MPEKQTGKSPRVSRDEKPFCYIHFKVRDNEVDDIRQNVCVNELRLAEHEDGNHYCLFHLPTPEKDIEKFLEIFNARLDSVDEKISKAKDLSGEEHKSVLRKLLYDFRGVWFPCGINLRERIFGSAAAFNLATFSAGADFHSATFSARADFFRTTFSGYTDFNSARFLETSQIFFRQTRFYGWIDFNYSVFNGYVSFEGATNIVTVFNEKDAEKAGAVLNLQNVRLEKPERLSFHRVRLCPQWFVNVDSRKIVLTDIEWVHLDAKWNNSNIIAEIGSLLRRNVHRPQRLLEIACRQLAVNAEDNNRYEEASKFRYMAMETKRLEYWWQGRYWTLNWWYRLSSGYGESWKRAAVVLIGVLALFGVLYASPLSRFDYGEKKEPAAVEKPVIETTNDTERFHHMGLPDGAVHSLYVSALQRPEPKAADTLTKFFVIMETILGPLQAALLALAIRRKFMR